MQLDDTNSPPTTLIGYTRFLVGDPATAPSTLWTDAEVTAAINQEYLFLRGIASKQSSGLLTAIAYESAVSGTALYDNPTGWHSWISIEMDMLGKNISTDTTANPARLEPRSQNSLIEGVNEGNISSIAFYYVQKNQFGIVTTPTATNAGTNNIRLTYNKVDTLLSADGDIPDIPAIYHDLICFRAAVTLKVSKDLPINDLGAMMVAKQAEYERWASDIHDDDYDFSVPAAGLVTPNRPFRTGSIKR